MSVKAMSWLWENSPARGTELLVLLALADFGGDDGRNVYPSMQTLAEKCRIDRRTAQRILSKLASEGKIIVESGGGRGRTSRYRIVMENSGDLTQFDAVNGGNTPPKEDRNGGDLPPNDEAETAAENRGKTSPLNRKGGKRAASDTEKGGTHAARTVKNLEPNPSLRSGLPARDAHPRATFDDFWAAYPRKVEKRASRTAWDRAVKRGADPAEITAGARRYRDDPNRIDQFTKHPPTWLNRDCWADDPLPARTDRKPTQTENSLGWLNVGREPQLAQQQLRAIEGGR